MKIDIYQIGKEDEVLFTLEDIDPEITVQQLKNIINDKSKKYPISRQTLRLSPPERSLSNSSKLNELKFDDEQPKLYLRMLGPQIGWTTVFLAEYIGPMFIYLFTFMRPNIPVIGNIYIGTNPDTPKSYVVYIAAICWTLHYLKRVLETLFVHRFSHATMPLQNLFKNCLYYWGAAFFVGYFINHPDYTEPYFKEYQVVFFLAGFIMCEIGNLSIHLLLRNLRPAGSNARAIPRSNANPLTLLFHLISCPNYAYEAGSWFCFSMMTQSLPALIFTGVGFVQMAIWALDKHKKYKREFEDYPKERKAIIPFIL